MINDQRLPVTPDLEAALEAFESEDTEWQPIQTDHEMVAVYRAMTELREAQHRLDDSVAAARAAGRSWEAVAVATGMTRQGATKRWQQHERTAS